MNSRTARHLMLFALTMALTLPCLVRNVSAQDGGAFTLTDNQTVPIDFIATSCNGETVIISGESHVLVHATATPSSNVTFTTHISFHLTGQTASGTIYHAEETVNSTETTSANGAYNLTSVGQLHLISEGGTDNLTVQTIIHTTVNSNGEITSTTFEFQTQCQG